MRSAAWLLVATVAAVAAVVPGGLASAATTASVADNSADRIVVWTACHQLYKLTDKQLDEWRDRGVRGFACNVQRLPGLGTTAKYSGDVKHLSGPDYVLERTLLESKIVERAHAHGMTMYLGFYFANGNNGATPLARWFDDAAWRTKVVPAVQGVASAARALGFDGLAFDQELYPQVNGKQTATWEWDSPGNGHSEQETRTKVRERGEQLMKAILSVYPDVDILAYFTKLPGTWDELVQEEVNGKADSYRPWVQLDLWDGLTAVKGYHRITFLNATFYKTPHVGTWDHAYTYEFNSLFALLSRHLDNWTYAATRVQETPFVWIGSGSTSFERARSPDEVAEQLDAARRWGMGRMFADYAYGDPQDFDYGPYEAAMRRAASAGVVDDSPPTITVAPRPKAVSAPTLSITGAARDDLAVRWVRWRTDAGTTGMAAMTWEAGPGSPTLGWNDWKMRWTAEDVPLHEGTNSITFTVEDIKGLQSTKTVEAVR